MGKNPNILERFTYKLQHFSKPSRLDLLNIFLHFLFVYIIYSHAKSLYSNFDHSQKIDYR